MLLQTQHLRRGLMEPAWRPNSHSQAPPPFPKIICLKEFIIHYQEDSKSILTSQGFDWNIYKVRFAAFSLIRSYRFFATNIFTTERLRRETSPGSFLT